MKTVKLMLLVPAIVLMSFNYAGLTDSEREFAVKHLKETKKDLMAKVKGLSDAQLNFKATPESWSIAECVEHIAITENMISGAAYGGLKSEADPSRRSELKMTDEQIVGFITDRSGKVKTQESMEPKNSYGSYKETLKAFSIKRDENIAFMQKTNEDMRNHFNDFPFGVIDTYQTMLFMSGHTKRHTEQIVEVMENANFPKK
ncbi:MAG: DinB family protein [Cyclobacteriaceae bacterium]